MKEQIMLKNLAIMKLTPVIIVILLISLKTSSQTVTGTGTINNLSKFTGPSSLGNSIIFDNGTNVGIGTTSPAYKLDVNGSGRFISDVLINSLKIGRGGGNSSTNTVFGETAGSSNTTGTYNIFSGYWAGKVNTTGQSNSFFGGQAGQSNTTGSNNTYMGHTAGIVNVSGVRNTFIGMGAGQRSTTGIDNVFLGCQSGVYSTTGSRNTFLGSNGGFNFSTGNDNIVIGYGAIVYNPKTTGSGNTIIGGNITGYDPAISNTVMIADGIGNVRLYSPANGNVGIGTTIPNANAKLDVNGNIYCNSKMYIGVADAATAGQINNYSLAVNGTAIFNKARVKLYGNWPDYVFENDYPLQSLPSIENFIKKYKHLPDVPGADEVKTGGIDLGDMQTILLKKMEEFTLHLIELNKKVEALTKENAELKAAIKK